MPEIRWGAVVLVSILALAPEVHSQSTRGLDLSPEQRLDSALALMRSGTLEGPRQAAEILLRLPDERVVPALVQALNNDPAFEKPEVRRLALTVLGAHQNLEYPGTYDLLLSGLQDPQTSEVCRNALTAAPPERRPDLARRLAERLSASMSADSALTMAAIEILVEYGPDARPAIEPLAAVLRDPRVTDRRTRITAGLAIAEIGGVAQALEYYHDLDSTGMEGALVGTSHLALKTNRKFGDNPEWQAWARRLVLGAFSYPSVTVVDYAFDALPSIYGPDLFEHSGSKPALRADVKSALIAAAQSAKQPELREALISGLEDLDRQASEER